MIVPGGIGRATAQTYIESYFTRYPGVKKFMDETREKAPRDGYVETVFGRRLSLPEIQSGSPARRQAAERAAINAPMQGTAADLIKLAMVSVQNWLDEKRCASKLIMQVHDELVLEVPEKELDHLRPARRIPADMRHVDRARQFDGKRPQLHLAAFPGLDLLEAGDDLGGAGREFRDGVDVAGRHAPSPGGMPP